MIKAGAVLATPLLIPLQLAAFWPVWRWYAQRTVDGSDEPWGILALISTVLVVAVRRRFRPPGAGAVMMVTVLAFVYTLGYTVLPPLLRAGFAALALACILSSISYGRAMRPALAGLMLLSLPLMASLQFFGGFPLRLITTHLVAFMLSATGYEVQAQGTLLRWAGEIIAVDAPCAGIKMLWSGLFLNFTLAAWANLGLGMTWLCTSLTLFSVFIGNVLRAAALFFTESGILAAPDFMHQAIGLAVFGLVAIAVFSIHDFNRRISVCPAG